MRDLKFKYNPLAYKKMVLICSLVLICFVLFNSCGVQKSNSNSIDLNVCTLFDQKMDCDSVFSKLAESFFDKKDQRFQNSSYKSKEQILNLGLDGLEFPVGKDDFECIFKERCIVGRDLGSVMRNFTCDTIYLNQVINYRKENNEEYIVGVQTNLGYTLVLNCLNDMIFNLRYYKNFEEDVDK